MRIGDAAGLGEFLVALRKASLPSERKAEIHVGPRKLRLNLQRPPQHPLGLCELVFHVEAEPEIVQHLGVGRLLGDGELKLLGRVGVLTELVIGDAEPIVGRREIGLQFQRLPVLFNGGL